MRTNEQVQAMRCPVDGSPLAMSDRQGIEIDYCPQCRGVWLDRGELDKIIERSAPVVAPAAPQQAPQPQAQPGYAQSWSGDYGRHPKQKRRKSFLEELFD
jgi:Zn-finger nucleic acid-binding protein